ncbi:UNVERIFIED_CONTAM: hypothetical protein Sradi_3799900 [Sesamum radiatum]|uniref:Uncharacterized protein n=1 Tax=Sesamum radiatum TaxID=300843 RepID=A0AAW2Q021_SESRA
MVPSLTLPTTTQALVGFSMPPSAIVPPSMLSPTTCMEKLSVSVITRSHPSNVQTYKRVNGIFTSNVTTVVRNGEVVSSQPSLWFKQTPTNGWLR